MRRGLGIVAVLGAAAAVAPACVDGDDLEGAECLSDADCWTGQTCVRSPTQNNRMLAGQCRSDGSCKAGEQLGCPCLVEAAGIGCGSTADFASLYPTDEDDAANCICCLSGEVAIEAGDGFLICDDPAGDSGSSGG